MDLTLLPHDHGDARRAALLRRQLLLGGDFGAAAELFRLLDDSSRLRIFWLLCHMEECVVNISAVTGMSSPAVSHHLRLLKDAGLVRSRREGKEVRYRAAETPTCRLLHEMIEKTMEISCPQLGEEEGEGALSAFSAEQVETVRRMHDELLQHPERRVPIEELARRYLMRSTGSKRPPSSCGDPTTASRRSRPPWATTAPAASPPPSARATTCCRPSTESRCAESKEKDDPALPSEGNAGSSD